jgi:hypothetical protein
MIKTAHINILDSSTVTLTAASEDMDYPLYRLWDRDIGRLFRTTVGESTEVSIDQGLAPQEVDMLIIPASHELSGMTLDIMHSDDDITYSPATAQWIAASGQEVKTFTPATKRYWRFIITTPATVPALAELILTSSASWTAPPQRPTGALDDALNVRIMSSADGHDRFLYQGEPRRRREYHIPRCSLAQATSVRELYVARTQTFWMLDHEGNWIYGRLKSPLNLRERAVGTWSYDFQFQEVLP